ncbi:MAG: hypothetical protein H5T45_00530 [Thermoplasmatales archaeon]|nr:hypothetical protein [Thermoplasmatales archaeon]
MSRRVKKEKVHNPKRRYEYALKHLNASSILDGNKKHIEKFAKSCMAEGIGKLRITKYIYTLTKISGMLKKDFYEANKEDIERIIYEIEESDLSEWSKHDYKATLKNFTGRQVNCKNHNFDLLHAKSVLGFGSIVIAAIDNNTPEQQVN